MFDELALIRVALEAYQLVQCGGHDARIAHVLARHRPVVQHARLPVQVPLAGLIQRLAEVLDVVALIPLPPAHGPMSRGSEPDDAALRVQGLDPVQGRGPRVIDEDVDVLRIVPLLEVAVFVAEADLGGRIAPLRPWVLDLGKRAVGAQVAVVRSSGPRSTFAIDEELVEVPFAGPHVRDLRTPELPGAPSPAGDDASAAENRRLAASGPVRDGAVLRARILGCEDDGRRQPIRAAAEDDGVGTVAGGARTVLSDGITSSGHRREGAVSAGFVGRPQRPRPRVVAIGGDVEVGSPSSAFVRGARYRHAGETDDK